MTVKGTFNSTCSRGHRRTPETVYKNGTCKKCNASFVRKWQEENRHRTNVFSKNWRDRFPEKYWSSSFRSRFKISRESYSRKILSQDNACAICSVSFDRENRPQVDHDHGCCPTNKACEKCFRGLLCRTCNLGIGYFRDNPALCQKAAAYVSDFTIKE
jgi:Recombination endonuclease VII